MFILSRRVVANTFVVLGQLSPGPEYEDGG